MTSRTAFWCCFALTLATLWARCTGLSFGVPLWEEPDPDIVGHVDLVREGWTTAAVEHPEEQYPHLVADIARWLPARPPASGSGAPLTLAGHLDAAAHTHVQVRALVAVLSTLLVPLTFLLARRFVRDGGALFAAALVATSLLHQSFAQQARPHGVAATAMTLALLAQLALVRSGSWRSYLWAGAATALALGSLHSASAVLLSGLTAHVGRSSARKWLDPKLLAPLALCAAAVVAFYPFLHGRVEQPRDVSSDALQLAEHAVGLRQFYGRGFGVLAHTAWHYEPVLSVLLAAALATWLATRRGAPAMQTEAKVLLAFALPYLIVVGLFERTYERFALPLLPCAAIFVAWALQSLPARWNAARALAVAALALPAAAVAKLAYLRTQPDTLDRAGAWFADRPREQRDVPIYVSAAAPALDLALPRREQGLLFHGKAPKLPLTPWTAWQTRVAPAQRPTPQHDLRWLTFPRGAGAPADIGAHLQSLAPALFLIEVYAERSNHPLQVRLRQELQQRGTRLARFGPDADAEASELELFFQLSDHFNDDEGVAWPHFTRRLLAAQAIGPVVEIWSIP